MSTRRPFRRIARRALAALAVALGFVVPAAQADVALHAFNWRYADVEARAADIQAAGFRIVLVSPAYRSEGSAWWARYQPQDLRVIDNPLGDTVAFKRMVDALKARGVRVYADVVANHMANEAAQRSDLNYPGSRVLGIYAGNSGYYATQRLFGNLSANLFGGYDFNPAACIRDYNSVYEVQNYRLCGGGADVGLPDLRDNDWVVEQQRTYLVALKTLGVQGFRVDAAKHMPVAMLNRIFTADVRSGMHVFGEIITNGGAGSTEYDRFLKPYLDGTTHGAYDFPLFNSIRSAFGFGGSMSQLVDPGAYGQALPGSRAITFTVTHDIPNNDGFRYLILDPTDETLAYAYVLGRDGGVPLLYSDNNESGDNRWRNAYQRADLRAMIRFHNAAQGTDQQVLSHGSCHILFRRGDRGIVGINKCGNEVTATVNTNGSVLWWNTNYTDVLDAGSVVNINSGSTTFRLPPRRARMWLR